MEVKQTKENPNLSISEGMECLLLWEALEQAGEKPQASYRNDIAKLRNKMKVTGATNPQMKDFAKIIQWEIEAIAQVEKILQLIVKEYSTLRVGQLVSQSAKEDKMRPFSQKVFALLEENDAFVNQTGYIFGTMTGLIQDLEVRVSNIMGGATDTVNDILWGTDKEYARCSDLRRIIEANKKEDK